MKQKLDEPQGKKDAHRIVQARLHLQSGHNTERDARLRQAKEDRNGRGVGRRRHGPEQERLGPGQAEQQLHDRPDETCADRDAQGGERDGRPKRLLQHAPFGAEASLEQNGSKRQTADQIGGSEIVELDSPRAVLARQHPDADERQEQRRSKTGGKKPRQGREQAEHARDEDDLVARIHQLWPSFRSRVASRTKAYHLLDRFKPGPRRGREGPPWTMTPAA